MRYPKQVEPTEGVIGLRFTGKGRGLLSGVTEYIQYQYPDELDVEEGVAAPGFELAETWAADVPSAFPIGRMLVVRGL